MMENIFWAAFGGGAAAGAFTLLAIGFAEWLRWFINRPLVSVKVWWAYYQDPISSETVRRISIDATNPHTKTVTLSGIGWGLRKGIPGFLAVPLPEPYALPYELDGGKSISELLDVEKLLSDLRRLGYLPSDLRFAWYKSQSGKMYKRKLDRKFINTLQSEFNTSN